MDRIEQFLNGEYSTIAVGALLLNVALMASSLILYVFWHNLKRNRIAVNDQQKIVESDMWAVFSTLICNVSVFVLGVFLWRKQMLKVDLNEITGEQLLLQILSLILIVDFLMYVFHKIAHNRFLYPFVHKKHHGHIGVNALSLFVLSPFEAIGFGLMLLGILFVYPFHYLAVGTYLTVNVLWGTIGHFHQVGAVSSKGWKSWLGTASFHNRHHLEPEKNFGFYTTLWDRLFKTHKTTFFK